MIRRRATLLLASAATALVLFGCGGDDGDSGSQATAAGKDKAGGAQAGGGNAVASGADKVARLCRQKRKRPLTAAQRRELHTAIGSMIVAYRRDPDAKVKQDATAGDALLNLAAGLVNHCKESSEAGRLLEAIRPKG